MKNHTVLFALRLIHTAAFCLAVYISLNPTQQPHNRELLDIPAVPQLVRIIQMQAIRAGEQPPTVERVLGGQ